MVITNNNACDDNLSKYAWIIFNLCDFEYNLFELIYVIIQWNADKSEHNERSLEGRWVFDDNKQSK